MLPHPPLHRTLLLCFANGKSQSETANTQQTSAVKRGRGRECSRDTDACRCNLLAAMIRLRNPAMSCDIPAYRLWLTGGGTVAIIRVEITRGGKEA